MHASTAPVLRATVRMPPHRAWPIAWRGPRRGYAYGYARAGAYAAAMVRVTLGAWPPSSKKTSYIEISTKMTFLSAIGWSRCPVRSHSTKAILVLIWSYSIFYMSVIRGFSLGRKILNLASTGPPGRFMISNFEFRISNHHHDHHVTKFSMYFIGPLQAWM